MSTRREQDVRHREVVRAYYETGNEALLNPVLTDLRPRLVAFLKAKGLRDRNQIQDLVQEALVHIIRDLRAHKFGEASSVAAWANGICWHRFTSYCIRKTNHITRPGMDEDPFLLLTLTSDEGTPVEPAEAAHAGALVMGATGAVLNLDADTRAVVALHYYQGLPVAVAAQQLGISPQMFRHRLRQGLAQLQSWARTQPAPTADTYAAVRHLDTGPLFQDPGVRLALAS